MNSPRKILFVSHEATRTGAPMFLLHFLRWLRRETSVEFELLVGRGGPLEDEFRACCPVHRPEAFLGRPAELARFGLIYANTACNTDLLDAIGTGGLPVITHVHELDAGFDWLGARRMASMVRQTHHFVACADAVARRLQEVFNVPAERISRHYEMIDADRVRANASAAELAALRQQYDIPADAQVLVGCGTFDLRKAPDVFVQVAGLLKRRGGAGRPWRFLWVGAQNSPDLVRQLGLDLRKLGLTGELRLIPEVASPHGLLALGDIFCLTSREDPFPLAMLEAAALGRPVVCFDGAGGGTEFCATGGGIAVPYLDIAAMATACAGLLEEPARRHETGRLGQAAVDARFTVGAVAPGLWQMIQAFPPDTTPVVPARATLAEIYAGWHDEAPQRVYRQAHLARAEVRGQARRLLAMGRRKDAAQLLAQAVNADLATKDVWTICEGLCEIADDFDSVDPRQAASLAAKAQDLARSKNLNISCLRPRKAPAAVAAA